MGSRLVAGVALVAVALLGLTIATPQDAKLGVRLDIEDVLDPSGGNAAGLKDIDPGDEDLGKLLDRIDGIDVDPDLVKNLDPNALADLLDGLTADELAALGMTAEEAQAYVDRLRDPSLSDAELEQITEELSDKGLRFVNDDADGRFDAGESAYADLDGDGKVSEGDVKLGVLALLLGIDRGLDAVDHDRLIAYQFAGGIGLGRPASSASRDLATGSTSNLAADAYPTDRALGPAFAVCVQRYSLSLTCHDRVFVQSTIRSEDGTYLFRPDLSAKLPPYVLLAAQPNAVGPRSSAHLLLEPGPKGFVAIPTLTPNDALVAMDGGGGGSLYRDPNGMVWIYSADRPRTVHLNVTWAVDLSYFDLPVAADVSADDVPAALRPDLTGAAQLVGLHIAEAAGATGLVYGDSIRALAQHIGDYGLGPLPDRDEQPDDLLAVADAQIGCARHRTAAFTLAAQSLGIPAHLVVNEAHVFAEAYVPRAGWHLVDLGGCGRLQVHGRDGHQEIMARQDLPYADEDRPPSQASAAGTDFSTASIVITELPPSLRRDTDFEIAGQVDSPDGTVPPGIPITFTYNRTKEQPGTPFCATQTQAGGAYRGTCRLGAGTPAGSLQLVARLAPSVIDGAASGPAYSDPPFVVQKATTTSLVGPARTSSNVAVAYTALVRDEDGAGVPQRLVTLKVDGNNSVVRATDATGRARFTLQLTAGSHTLAATLAGDDTYDPSGATLRIDATAPRITVGVDQVLLDQGSLTVQGTVANGNGNALAGRTLTLQWRNDPDGPAQTRTTKTSATGTFKVAFDGTPRAGPGLVSVVDSASNVGVDAAFARTVDATATILVPPRWALGTPVPVEVRVNGPSDPVPLRLLLNGEVVADLEAGSLLPATALVTLPDGVHTLTLEAGAGVRLSTTPSQVVAAPVEADLDPVVVQAPGTALVLTGTLRFDGQGLPGPVQLRLLGTTANATAGSDGRFTLRLDVPATARPGNATAVLALPDVGTQLPVPVRIQRPANLVLDAPSLSLHAFGATQIRARGEGVVNVVVDGRPLPAGPDPAVPTKALFWRHVTIEVRATPSGDELSPSTATATILVVNPVTFTVGPAMIALATWLTVTVVRRVRASRAYRNRFLPLPARTKVKILHPVLPRRVPRVFDPALDGHLMLRLPGPGPWRVLDAAGQAVPHLASDANVRIDLDRLASGRNDLRFVHEERAVRFTFDVQDLRSALDDSTLGLLQRIGKPDPWPTLMEALERGLTGAGATVGDARVVRREAEGSLYAVDAIGRERFHAYFAALDAAQARRRSA